MPQIILETDTLAQAQFLSAFLKNVNIVKSVSIEPNKSSRNVVNEPAEGYNWTNPSRPATDEEFEQMISECENSPSMTMEEAKKHTYKLLDKWNKRRK